jgi:hypothetical protein
MTAAHAFSVIEWVFLLAGVIGGTYASLVAWGAYDDYQTAEHRRVRQVAIKNIIAQGGMALAQSGITVIGLVSVLMPVTPSQSNPTPQTWVFYVGIACVAVVLAVTSVWTHVYYERLIGTANTGGNGNG